MITMPMAGCFGGDDSSDAPDEELDDWNVPAQLLQTYQVVMKILMVDCIMLKQMANSKSVKHLGGV